MKDRFLYGFTSGAFFAIAVCLASTYFLFRDWRPLDHDPPNAGWCARFEHLQDGSHGERIVGISCPAGADINDPPWLYP